MKIERLFCKSKDLELVAGSYGMLANCAVGRKGSSGDATRRACTFQRVKTYV